MKRIYTSKLYEFKNIIDKKIENQNVPATGICFLLKNKYGYEGKYCKKGTELFHKAVVIVAPVGCLP